MQKTTAIAPQSQTSTPAVTAVARSMETTNNYHTDTHILQRKLAVGAVDDPLEHEADAMADRVMRMPETHFVQRKCAGCEDEEKQVQRKPLAADITPFIQRKGGEGAVVSDALSSQIESSKGSGSPMSEPTRNFMESRFGADFSDVRLHTDSDAVQMSQGLNAQAFTVGRDVYFNSGKYTPDAESGKHLLAHELTHTVQQSNSARALQQSQIIQRKIEINGKEHVPSDIEKKTYNVELLKKLYNDGKEPVHYFINHDEFHSALLLRQKLADIMPRVIPKVNFHFGRDPVSSQFKLPTAYWEASSEEVFIVKEGKEPDAAVKSIFNGPEDIYIDCNMAVVAAQYYSMLELFGSAAFNKMFPGGKDLNISQILTTEVRSYVTPGTDSRMASKDAMPSDMHPLDEKKVFPSVMSILNIKIDPSDPTKDLLPGDWVYFENIVDDKVAPDYKKMLGFLKSLIDNDLEDKNSSREGEVELTAQQKEDAQSDNSRRAIASEVSSTASAWQGEHAVYLGDEKFAGFPLGRFDYSTMKKGLFDWYMKVIKAYFYHPFYESNYQGPRNKEELLGLTNESLPNTPGITRIRRLDYSKLSKLGKK